MVQVTKQSFAYVLDRVTGKPVWPIEERPVPQSTVPGEKSAATQPFPTRPPAFDRQGVTVDDLIRRAKASGQWDDDPVLRNKLAQLAIEGRINKITNLRAAAARGGGKRPGPEGSITKLFQAEYNKRLQVVAIEMLGARATAWNGNDDAVTGASVRGFLRSRANTIEGGTSEIMRNILGERVLGLPKEPSTDRDIPWVDIPRGA